MRHLVYSPQEYPCGYAPRILRRSLAEHEELADVLFVGAKDGSVTVLSRRHGEADSARFEVRRLPFAGGRGAPAAGGVRVIRNWGPDWLLLGRNDGTLEAVQWNQPPSARGEDIPRVNLGFPREARRTGSGKESLRYATWLLERRRLIFSFREAGTFVADLESEDPDPEVLRRAVLEARRIDTEGRNVGGIRLAAEIGNSGEILLLDQSCRICRWEAASVLVSPLPEAAWDSRDVAPAFLNDIAYVGPPKGRFKDVRGLILSTDTGVYALDLRRGKRRSRRPLRLPLPSAGMFYMSATYVECGNRAYMWLTNRRGDSYLFENGPLTRTIDFRDWALGFSSSGLVQTNSQVMIALSWVNGDAIWLAQASRNDRVRIHCFSETSEGPAEEEDVFRLLQGPAREPKEVLKGLKDFLRRSAGLGGKAMATGNLPPYAVLAEVFEVLASDEKKQERLLEFLSAPVTHAAEALLKLSAEQKDGKEPWQHLLAAVKLWNLCLIGVVNRQPSPREECFLGILRFLRGLTAAFAEPPLAIHRARLLPAIEEAIRLARKWGLYGEVNEVRQNLVVPLKILKDRRGQRSSWIDELTYSSLLFRRSYSVVLEDRSHQGQGHHAWALSTLGVGAGTVVAVSWRRGGIELKLIAGGTVSEARWHETPLSPPEPARDKGGEAGQYGYSRDVLLFSAESESTKDEDVFYLLTATVTRSREETNLKDELRLWRGRLSRHSPEDVQWDLPSTLEGAGLERGESVFRFLDLGSGHLAVGLRGIRGRAKVVLIEIASTAAGKRLRLGMECELMPPPIDKPGSSTKDQKDLVAESSSQNRVWSLAKIERTGRPPGLLAGCENGEIWQVSIEETGPDREWRLTCRGQVGRLAARVTALACRRLGKKLRVFAGAQDGTVVCFQELSWKKENEARFATLWATVEKEAICFIDVQPYGRGKGRFSLALAVAHNGMLAAIDDRDSMRADDLGGEGRRPRRFPFPGIRRLRSHTGMACFAASTVEPRGWDTSEEGTWRYLVTASDSGELRVISLHYPRYTRERRDLFRAHLSRLWDIARLDGEGRPEYLRVVEAAYRGSRLLPLILVRWLLDPDFGETERDPGEREQNRLVVKKLLETDRWWYPRLLRPLCDVREAWEKPSVQAGRIAEGLRQLLHGAWRWGDVDLFQEVCLLALKRVNYWICDPDSEKAPEATRDLYFEVFRAIESSLQLWTGADQETRVRCTVAKNLVDGDTFLRLIERVVEQGKDSEESGKKSPWFEIVGKRIEGVRQLVFKGDILVSLESLRAANHSLLRLCSRLSGVRDKEQSGLTAIPWPYFEGYFRQLVYGAAQAFRANPSLSDALLHEYSRTFALCLSACPEGAVRIANRLTEARLILDPLSKEDLFARIESQFSILEDSFGVTFLPGLRRLVGEILLRPNLENLNPIEMFEKSVGEEKPSWIHQPCAGIHRDLRELAEVYEILTFLMELERDLSTDARELNLTREGLKPILDQLRASFRNSAGLYKHSLAFWTDALEDLLTGYQLPLQQSKAKIRPEVVLFSSHLAKWAESWRSKLVRRYQEARIFQPQYKLFDQALLQLRQAAEGFALGAAVQKNLVVGLLGHHLLEDLDLHVLELREIARNLDPLVFEGDEGQPSREASVPETVREERSRSTESEFSALLVRRARRALSLPKNLRSLAKVLDPASREPRSGGLFESIQELVSDEPGSWRSTVNPEDGPKLEHQEHELLALVLRELDQNHQEHSGFGKATDDAERPNVSWNPGRRAFTLKFPVEGKANEDSWKRLRKQVKKLNLQQPCRPNPKATVASTGAGLYLSCLAAAMVGWTLSIKLHRDPELPAKGWCYLHLKVPPGRPLAHPENRGQDISVLSRQASPVKNIVVVDDKPAVAFYVWREIGNVPGFGVAEVSEKAARARFWLRGIPVPLETPAGDVAVWWVAATDTNWREDLSGVLKRIPSDAPCHFLVDVRGPADDGDGESDVLGKVAQVYVLQDVLAELGRERSQDQVWLISSYKHGTIQGKLIHAKTPMTFQRFARWNPEAEREKPPLQEIHVLVTGAGFELRDSASTQRVGMPSTSDLLMGCIMESFANCEVVTPKKGGYPMPQCLQKELEEPATNWDLDRYWDVMLATERSRYGADPLKIVRRETQLRESFRKQLALYDWGYLSQGLAAARLPWGAWLSTNYTRFADRAIERLQRPDWRLIETREEAEGLDREILYDQRKWSARERLLFKLHGDSAHVLTMAIAAEDKTFLSRIQSFAPLYLAARSYLRHLAGDSRNIVWHIVGHGLRDELLVKVICDLVASRSKEQHHKFVVVSLSEEGSPADQRKQSPSTFLRLELGKIENAETLEIVPVRSTAERYLANLEREGLAAYADVAGLLTP